MILQSENLSMLGLGILNDEDIVDGNHLRWFFNPELGFPKYGFLLYRRRHRSCEKRKKIFDFRVEDSVRAGRHPSPLSRGKFIFETDNKVVIDEKDGHKGIFLKDRALKGYKYLKINFPEVVKSVLLHFYSKCCEEVDLTVTYYFNSLPFYEKTMKLEPGTQVIEIVADAIDCICLVLSRVLAKPIILERIQWTSVSKCNFQWGRYYKRICLPVKHSDYPCDNGQSGDWEAAQSRLDENKKDKYDEETFIGLQGYLEELVKKSILPQYERVVFISKENIESTLPIEDMQDVDVSPLQTVLTSALDPGTAQILGLYYVDFPHSQGIVGPFDYRIVGCWTKRGFGERYKGDEERLEDMYPINFSTITLDDPPVGFEKRGFNFWSTHVISVGDCPIEFSADGSICIRAKEYLGIDFPRLMSMVHVGIRRTGGTSVTVRIHRGNGSVKDHTFPLENISKIFENHHIGIKSIEILGDFCLCSFSYAEMDYAWITFDIEMEKRDRISSPTGLKTYLLPGKSVVKEDRIVYAPATVGLKWDLPSLSVFAPDRHVFYELYRDLGGPVNGGTPIFVPRLPGKEDETSEVPEFPEGWPPQTEEEKEQGIMPIFYVDAGDKGEDGLLETPLTKNNKYEYHLEGIDIFGRHSYPSRPAFIFLVDKFPPPPPLVMSSKFLDPKDPYLQEEEIVWVANAQNIDEVVWDSEKGWVAEGRENRKGFRTIWEWTENLHIQAPDAEKFRIYVKRELLNVLEGTIHEILFEKRGYHVKGEITEFDAEKNIVSLNIRTKKELEVDIAYYQRFFKYYTNFFSIGKVESSTWNGFIQQISFTIGSPRSVSMKKGEPGIFDADYSRIEVYFDGEIEIQENSFAGRMLRQRGRNFLIMRNTASEILIGNPITRMTLVVQNLVSPPREIPGANNPVSLPVDQDNPLYAEYGDPENWKMVDQHGDEVVIEVGMNEGEERIEKIENQWGDPKEIRYRLFDRFIPEDSLPEQYHLFPTPQEPITSESVGMTTIDESGNESRVSPPQPVFAVLRDIPETPSAPDISTLWATIPDYYGMSYFDVEWGVTERDYFYQVYRTMDKTLMSIDAEEHDKHLPLNGVVFGNLWDDQDDRKDDIEEDLGKLDEKIFNWRNAPDDEKQRKFKELMEIYFDLRNDTWQYLASLPENEKAFSPVSDPLDPNNPENWSGSNMLFQDSLKSKGRNHYFYRTGAMDKAGNRSSLSTATPPVCVRDANPPEPPVTTKVFGGDRKAVICWKRNREPGMVEYEIYRTNEKACSVDVRLMEKVAEIEADAEGMPLRARIIKSSKEGEFVLSGYLDVAFVPNAQSVNKVYEIDGNGNITSEMNYFGGFRSLILKVSIDDGNTEVRYMDTEGNDVVKSIDGFGGQVILEIKNAESPVASVIGVYRGSDTEHSESILEGISSGEIVLQSEDISQLRDKEMAVNYIDIEGNPQTAEKIPYELEYTDEDLQAGTYYYCLVAVREGVIGENAGTEKTIELISFPSELVTAIVYDRSPPEPPEWQRVEWIKIDEQGNEHPWDEEVQTYTPAVVLEWDLSDPAFSYLVQKREVDSAFWKSITSWLKGENRYIDRNVSPETGYEYRIRVKNLVGSVEISEIYSLDPIEIPPDE